MDVHGETIRNKRQHLSYRNADIIVVVFFFQAEDGIRDDHDQDEWKDHFQDVVLDIARGREFKGVTRILMARRQRVHERLDLPFLYGPIWQGNRWRDPAGPFKPVLNPNLIWYEHYFVGLIPNCDQLDAKSLPIERE